MFKIAIFWSSLLLLLSVYDDANLNVQAADDTESVYTTMDNTGADTGTSRSGMDLPSGIDQDADADNTVAMTMSDELQRATSMKNNPKIYYEVQFRSPNRFVLIMETLYDDFYYCKFAFQPSSSFMVRTHRITSNDPKRAIQITFTASSLDEFRYVIFKNILHFQSPFTGTLDIQGGAIIVEGPVTGPLHVVGDGLTLRHVDITGNVEVLCRASHVPSYHAPCGGLEFVSGRLHGHVTTQGSFHRDTDHTYFYENVPVATKAREPWTHLVDEESLQGMEDEESFDAFGQDDIVDFYQALRKKLEEVSYNGYGQDKKDVSQDDEEEIGAVEDSEENLNVDSVKERMADVRLTKLDVLANQ